VKKQKKKKKKKKQKKKTQKTDHRGVDDYGLMFAE